MPCVFFLLKLGFSFRRRHRLRRVPGEPRHLRGPRPRHPHHGQRPCPCHQVFEHFERFAVWPTEACRLASFRVKERKLYSANNANGALS